MKLIRSLIITGVAMVSLAAPVVLQAQSTPTPVVVPENSPNLKGLPAPVVAVFVSFDLQRDKYLAEQRLLLLKLQNATTPEEREAIRQKLEANREQFLADLADFRSDLKDVLGDLKGKISCAEIERIINDARHLVAEGGLHHHRGQ